MVFDCETVAVVRVLWQVNENKKRADDQQATIDGYDDVKKKMQRDIDALQQRVEAMTDENDRLNKSKKKMQTEVSAFYTMCQRIHFLICKNLTCQPIFIICCRFL